jgi:hypothetical protein
MGKDLNKIFPMSGEALIFMLVSWGIIWGLTVFCFTLLLTHPEVERISSPREDVREEEIT